MEFPVTNLYELDSRVFQVQKKQTNIQMQINYRNCNSAGQLEHPVQARGEPRQVLGGCNQAGG